jgi:hypothetical protein
MEAVTNAQVIVDDSVVDQLRLLAQASELERLKLFASSF